MDYAAAPQGLGDKKFHVSRAYQSIPEARDLEWSDSFFEDEEGIVAVFDFDYLQIVDFNFQTALVTRLLPFAPMYFFYLLLLLSMGLDPIFALAFAVATSMVYLLVTLTPCLLRPQLEWEAYAQHVAITRDGIRFVQDQRKGCWGLSICDKGRHSKTVPYDKVTDCDVLEPAGSNYCCIQRVLTTVNVDTASSGGEGKSYELKITGLHDPRRFMKLVWAMKRSGTGFGSAAYEAPTTLEMTERSRHGLTTTTGTAMGNAFERVPAVRATVV